MDTKLQIDNKMDTTTKLQIDNNMEITNNNMPPFDTDYIEININDIICLQNKSPAFITECMRLTIGKHGTNFKKITEKYNMKYIFHKIEYNTIEIWGDKEKFTNVRKEIMNHLEWSYQYLQTKDL